MRSNPSKGSFPFISIEDRLRDLTPAQRLEGLSLEDRIEDLSDEEREVLRQLLDGKKNGT